MCSVAIMFENTKHTRNTHNTRAASIIDQLAQKTEDMQIYR